MEQEKEMTIQEMQEEILKHSYEIAKLHSIIKKHQKAFDDLSYKIWLKQKEQKNEPIVSADSENN